MFFDKGDEIGGSVASQGRLGEVRIPREEILWLAVEIGEIAASPAGNEDFFADFFGAFEDGDAAATFAGLDGAEEAGCASAKNEDVVVSQKMVTVQRKSAGLKTGHYTGADARVIKTA